MWFLLSSLSISSVSGMLFRLFCLRLRINCKIHNKKKRKKEMLNMKIRFHIHWHIHNTFLLLFVKGSLWSGPPLLPSLGIERYARTAKATSKVKERVFRHCRAYYTQREKTFRYVFYIHIYILLKFSPFDVNRKKKKLLNLAELVTTGNAYIISC